MQKKGSAPFFRFTLFFIIGILIGKHTHIVLNYFFFVLPIGMILIYIFCLYLFKQKLLLGVLGLIILSSIGFLKMRLADDTLNQQHINHIKEKIDYYAIKVIDIEKENSFVVELRRVKTKEGWRFCRGKGILYIGKSDAVSFSIGDIILMQGAPASIKPPLNPHEFNYKLYLQNRNIFFSGYIQENHFLFIKEATNFNIKNLTHKLKKNLKNKLRKYIKNNKAYAIMLALVLGDKQVLNDNTSKQFSQAGAMHILAVSGLHVGVLYGFLMLFISRLRNRKWGKLMIFITSLLVLWGYALLTGLTSSVVRAVIMFSCFSVAKFFKKEPNLLNTLSFSAFLILWYNPLTINYVGFQLSFLAVLGIIFVYPKIYKSFCIKNSLIDKVWSLICISLAVQVATFPISIYYFHQFPVYFLITNIFAIPMAFAMLGIGILFLLLSTIHPIAFLLGWCLEKLTLLLSFLLKIVLKLPFSTIQSIYFSEAEILILYIIIVSFLIYVYHHKKLFWLTFCTLMCFAWSLVSTTKTYLQAKQRKIIIYHVSKHFALDIIDGREHAFFSSLTNSNKINYHIKPTWTALGLRSSDKLHIPIKKTPSYDLLVWKNQKILIIKDESFTEKIFDKKLYFDYIIITSNAIKNLDIIGKNVMCQEIIVDGSNKKKLAQMLKKQAKKLNLSYYTTFDRGAYTINN